MAHSVDIKTL